jgi:hypothetical protein
MVVGEKFRYFLKQQSGVFTVGLRRILDES